MPQPTPRQIERGRKLAASLNTNKWDLGDLALEVAPESNWSTSPERAHLEKLAEEIDLTFDQIVSYRRVAEAFPKTNRRSDVSWTVHRELTHIDNRTKVLRQRKTWTLRTVRDYLGRTPIDYSKNSSTQGKTPAQSGFSGPSVGRELTRDEEVDVARRVLRDPAAARAAMQDPVARSTGIKAVQEAIGDAADLKNPDRLMRREIEPERPQGGIFGLADEMHAEAVLRRVRRMVRVLVRDYEERGIKLEGEARETVELAFEDLTKDLEIARIALLERLDEKELAAFLREEGA